MSFCPQCRSALEPGARFCANCGNTLGGPPMGAPPGGPRPFAGAAPGYGPPQGAPPGYGPPPGQPPGYGPPPGQPPGYGAPPGPPGYGPPPVAPPAADDGGMKVLGGCGVAGCIGAVVAVFVGIGLIMVLVMVAGSSSSSSSSSSGPSSGPGGEVPENGSVRDLIRSQVGSYRLVGTTPLKKVPAGVVDSIGAVYQSPGGVKVFHILLVYPSDSIASDRIETVWRDSLGSLKAGQKVQRGSVKDAQGNVRGTIVAVTGRSPESYYWNNRKLVSIVEGPIPHAKGFESTAPY